MTDPLAGFSPTNDTLYTYQGGTPAYPVTYDNVGDSTAISAQGASNASINFFKKMPFGFASMVVEGYVTTPNSLNFGIAATGSDGGFASAFQSFGWTYYYTGYQGQTWSTLGQYGGADWLSPGGSFTGTPVWIKVLANGDVFMSSDGETWGSSLGTMTMTGGYIGVWFEFWGGPDPAVTINSVTIETDPLLAISDQSSNYVTFYDPIALDAVGNSAGIDYQYGIAASPDGLYVYLANTGAERLYKISTIDGSTVATATYSSYNSRDVALSPDGTTAYLGDMGTHLYVIDTASMTVTHTVTDLDTTWGVAVTPDGSTVYVASNVNDGAVYAVDTSSFVVTTITTGQSYPAGIAIDPFGLYCYVANNYTSNTVSVIEIASNTVVGEIDVSGYLSGGEHPIQVAVTPDNTQLWVSVQESDRVVYCSTGPNGTAQGATSISSGANYGLAIAADGSRVYVPFGSGGDGEVASINTSTKAVVNNFSGGEISDPWGVAVASDYAPPETLYIVQSMSVWGSAAGVTVDYNFATTDGNLLVAFATDNHSEGPILTPSGWTQLFQDYSGVEGGVWYKYTSGGETSSTWSDTEAGDDMAVAIYEIYGADPSNPFDQYSYLGNNWQDTTPVTPTVVGDLALAAAFTNSTPSAAAAMTPAGWVVDQFAGGSSYHGLASAHQMLLTLDTTTPVNPTFTWSSDQGMTVLVLVQPPQDGPSGPPIPSFMVI